MPPQTDLFDPPLEPAGLRLEPRLVGSEDQSRLIAGLAHLPFAPFEFQGWLGARRIVSFGSRYDFSRGRLEPAEPLPPFLLDLAERAAIFAEIDSADMAQALVTEYQPGAGIGWHRDRPQYDRIVGISLGSACRLRFRKRTETGWARRSLALEPGSAYLLDGPARTEWEHSIAPMAELRYSITFRTLRKS